MHASNSNHVHAHSLQHLLVVSCQGGQSCRQARQLLRHLHKASSSRHISSADITDAARFTYAAHAVGHRCTAGTATSYLHCRCSTQILHYRWVEPTIFCRSPMLQRAEAWECLCTHSHTHPYTHTHTHTHTHTCTHTYTHTCTHTHAHTHTRTHTCTHAHTHAYTCACNMYGPCRPRPASAASAAAPPTRLRAMLQPHAAQTALPPARAQGGQRHEQELQG